MKRFFNINDKLLEYDIKARGLCTKAFDEIDAIAMQNQHKVLAAFINNGVSESHLGISTGYGYGDRGRDTLEQVLLSVWGLKTAL